MSQSDYIKLKKTSMILKNNELPPVLTPEDYTDFVQYNLETTVTNTKKSYSRLLLPGNRDIFDMEKNVSGCVGFILCTNTNERPNRVLNTAVAYPYSPTPTKKYIKNVPYPPCPCSVNKPKKYIKSHPCACLTNR
jgi:hypothetical protein